MMQSIVRLLLYGGFAASIAYLSAAPGYRLLGESEAMLSLSFSHAAERVEACRRLSQEELQSLPPNMRKPDDCPRERHPVDELIEELMQLGAESVFVGSGIFRSSNPAKSRSSPSSVCSRRSSALSSFVSSARFGSA